MKKIFLLLTVVFALQQLPAQVTSAPLPLYITGSGKVAPFHDGQVLRVGRDYIMQAIPELGSEFSGWRQVGVFTLMLYSLGPSGDVTTNIITDVIPEGEPVKHPILVFTMQPEDVISDGTNFTATLNEGWQANFAPIEVYRGRR